MEFLYSSPLVQREELQGMQQIGPKGPEVIVWIKNSPRYITSASQSLRCFGLIVWDLLDFQVQSQDPVQTSVPLAAVFLFQRVYDTVSERRSKNLGRLEADGWW